uniref:Uncharacterized protein n=1 Tax=Lygus hesperus TaxID=30085 RepID=A0A146LRG9_LYGHE
MNDTHTTATITTTATATACCPFHRIPTLSPSMTPTMEVMGIAHCPVVGTAPLRSCPLELDVTHNATMASHTPTLLSMVQQMGKSQLSAYVAATAFAGYVIGGGVATIAAM